MGIQTSFEKARRQRETKGGKETLEDTAPRDRTIGAFPTYVFTASVSSDYHLRDSFLLDTAASAHVCNNRARFYDLRPATEDDYPYAGNTVIPIEGFGLVDILAVQRNHFTRGCFSPLVPYQRCLDG